MTDEALAAEFALQATESREQLGSCLRAFRQQCLLTQEKAAARAGISPVHLSDLEIGVEGNPKLDTVLRLVQVYGVGLEALLDIKKTIDSYQGRVFWLRATQLIGCSYCPEKCRRHFILYFSRGKFHGGTPKIVL